MQKFRFLPVGKTIYSFTNEYPGQPEKTQEEKINNILFNIGFYLADLSYNNQLNEIQNNFSKYFKINIFENEYFIQGNKYFFDITGIQTQEEYNNKKHNYIGSCLNNNSQNFYVNDFIIHLQKLNQNQSNYWRNKIGNKNRTTGYTLKNYKPGPMPSDIISQHESKFSNGFANQTQHQTQGQNGNSYNQEVGFNSFPH